MSIDVLSIVDAIVADLFPSKPVNRNLSWQRLRAKGDPDWYQAYLRSHHWRRFRKQILSASNYRCSKCGASDPNHDQKRGTRLHVHHKTYERVGSERPSDVEALCRFCHKAEHT